MLTGQSAVRRGFVAIAVFAVLLAGCVDSGDGRSLPPVGTTTREQNAEAAAALDGWEQYRKASLDADGKTAASLLSEGTVNYYAALIDATLHADAATLEKSPVIDIATVLIARFEYPSNTLKGLDGRGFLELALTDGLISEQTVAKLSFARAEVVGNTARLMATDEDQAIRRLDMRREGGRWKVHLVSLIRDVARQFDRQAGSSGISRVQTALALIRRTRPEAGEQLLVPPA